MYSAWTYVLKGQMFLLTSKFNNFISNFNNLGQEGNMTKHLSFPNRFIQIVKPLETSILHFFVPQYCKHIYIHTDGLKKEKEKKIKPKKQRL
jgi:hypothetical protein